MNTPNSSYFTTTHKQTFKSPIFNNEFGFVNAVPDYDDVWHTGAMDHTPDDIGGYMYLVNVGAKNIPLFNLTVNNLCLGLEYTFSAYLSNVENGLFPPRTLPNIRFEARSGAFGNELLAQLNTSDININISKMVWSQFCLTFIAAYSSVNLLLISNTVSSSRGNNLAIDDVELRVNATGNSGLCPPG